MIANISIKSYPKEAEMLVENFIYLMAKSGIDIEVEEGVWYGHDVFN